MPLDRPARTAAWRGFLAALAVALFATVRAPCADGTIAVVGGAVHTGEGSVIEDGVVVVRDGAIAAIGKRGEVDVPAGIERVDAAGLQVAPGFVSLRGQLLVSESDLRPFGDAASLPIADAIDPFAPDWQGVRDAGVTTVAITGPLAGNVTGPGAVLHLRHDASRSTSADPFGGLLLARESHVVIALGVSSGGASTSAARLSQYTRVRGLLRSARDYAESWKKYREAVEKYNKAANEYNEAKSAKDSGAKKGEEGEEGDKKAPKRPTAPKPPSFRLASEMLARALAGEVPVLVEAHRADGIGYARRLRDEFGLRMAIVGGTRAAAVGADLAEDGIPVAVAPVLATREALEYRGHDERTPRRLIDAKAAVAIATGETSAEAIAQLRLEACVAVRGGLDPATALRAITLEPAKILGIDDRVGTIAIGKRGDLVLLDGAPVDARSRVVQVIVAGVPGARRENAPRRVLGAAKVAAESGPPEPLALGAVDVRVLTRARVVTMSPDGRKVEIIDNASLLVRDGKIARVVAGELDVPVPDGSVVDDLGGAWVLPGFIDAHSHAALAGDLDDLSSAFTADFRVLDGFDPWSEDVVALLRRGVTSIALSPGRSNVVSGEVSLLKLSPGRVPMRVVARRAAFKTSLVPVLDAPRYPTAPSGAVESLDRWIGDLDDAMRETPLLVYFQWRSQAERLLETTRRLGVRAIFIEGIGTDSRTFTGVAAPDPFILGPYSAAESELVLRAPGALATRGRLFAFGTSGTRIDPLSTVSRCLAHGLEPDAALRALTHTPAAIYGVADRLGAIRAGADADLVVWGGDPFSMNAAVRRVYVDGALVIDGDRVLPGRAEAPGEATVRDAVERKASSSALASADESSRTTQDGDEIAEIIVRADRVYTVSGEPIDDGVIRIRGGKIVAVGREMPQDVSDARVVVVSGTVIPGLIDAGSSLGLTGRHADEFRELTPATRVLDGVDLDVPERRHALLGGVTTVAVSPGDRNVIGGLGAVIKTHGDDRTAAVLRSEAFVAASLTAAAHSGNRTMRSGRPTSYTYRIPTTRMGTIFLARRALVEAQHDGWPDAKPESGLSAMLRPDERVVLRDVLAGRRKLRVRAETRAEIRTALRIGQEFGIRVEIEGGRESLGIVDELAASGATVLLDLDAHWGGRELESTSGLSGVLPEAFASAGIRFAFCSNSGDAVDQLRERMIHVQRHGLDERVALRSVTLDADLVALSGAPFAATSAVVWVMAGGRVIEPDTAESSVTGDPASKPPQG